MRERDIKEGVVIAPYTTFGVGGPARFFVETRTTEELIEALRFAKKEDVPVFLLGGGSNILVSDEGLERLVIHFVDGTIEESRKGDTLEVIASAAVPWDALVEQVTRKGWSGIENLSGIPGTVGAAPIQNIGAYGTEVGASVSWVEAYDPHEGTLSTLSAEECRFGYRDSIFKHTGNHLIVVRVAFTLTRPKEANISYPGLREELERSNVAVASPEDIRRSVCVLRERKGMLATVDGEPNRTAGSFFKAPFVSLDVIKRAEEVALQENPQKVASLGHWFWEMPDGRFKIAPAFLMEFTPFNKTDFKDKRFNGSVSISPRHTLSLVNVGNATARDIIAFAEHIQEAVHEKFGVKLEPEVCFVGFDE